MKLLVEVSLIIFALFNAQWFVLCPVSWVRFVCVVCSHVDAFLLMKKTVYFESVWPSVVLFFAMGVKNREGGILTLFKHFGNVCLNGS